MRTMRAKLLIASLILLLFVAIFACVGNGQNVAYAGQVYYFSINTTDGYHWELRRGDWVITFADGDFINYLDRDDPAQPALIFYNVIQATLEDEDDAYVLTFNLPSPTISFKDDISSNPYTESTDSEIVVEVPYTALLSSESVFLEYKPKDASDDEYVSFPANIDNRFGQNVPKGEYDIRARVEEQHFNYYGTEYNIIVYSANTLACEITDSELPDRLIHVPSVEELTFEYGVTLKDIADQATALSRNGSWTVSEIQNPNQKFDAMDGERTLYLDFKSKNPNYNVKHNIAVSVRVTKRRFIVYIPAVDILQGKPISLPTAEECHFFDELAPDDTLESIGFSIICPGLDPNVVGDYSTYISIANTNYDAISKALYDSEHLSHGWYRVHSNSVDVSPADLRKMTIAREDGFIGITVVVHYIGDSVLEMFDFDGYLPIAGYYFTFEDENGEALSNLGALTITLEKRADDYAVVYFENNELHYIVLDDSMTFTLPNNVVGFVIVKPLARTQLNTVEWNATLTALSILLILLVSASWIVVVIYHTKRRFLND